jgi:hypothetical protein
MGYEVTIRDTETNEVRTIGMNGIYIEREWLEDGFSCDCNRHVIFNGGFSDEHPCGTTRYDLEEVNIRKEDLM